MSRQTALGLTYPEKGDHTRLWEHYENLAVTSGNITGNKIIRTGFLNAGPIGAVAAGSSFGWNIDSVPGLQIIEMVFVTWKYMSLSGPGYLGPGSGQPTQAGVVVSAGVQWQTSPNGLQVTAYFPKVYTPDNRGREGVVWMAVGTA